MHIGVEVHVEVYHRLKRAAHQNVAYASVGACGCDPQTSQVWASCADVTITKP